MRILLITGRLAGNIVRNAVESIPSKYKEKHIIEIMILPIDVIALASSKTIAYYLKKKGVKKGDYDLIIIPGQVKGSAIEITNAIGIPAVKGPKQAIDIPIMFAIDLNKLSPDEPADKIIDQYRKEYLFNILKNVEENIKKKPHINIGRILVPVNPPPIRVIAEISNTLTMSRDILLDKIKTYLDNGANIISLGFEPFNPNPDKVYETIKYIKKESINIPIAIDTLSPSEIISGINAGADLILSITVDNVAKIKNYIKDIAVVAIPIIDNTLPRDHDLRLQVLFRIVDTLHNYTEKIIADPILDPPGRGTLFKSMQNYMKFKQIHPNTPLLMGIGNVTELIDADSVGINVLLTLLAQELGVSLLLVTEESTKTQGSVRETAIASQMNTISWVKHVPPKDLGIDLLILKDKKKTETPFDITRDTKVVDLRKASYTDEKTEIDPMGFFKIRINYSEQAVEAFYVGRKGRILIKSRSSKSIERYILENKLISTLSHAFYLGGELAKAEEALRINKNYVQGKPLFSLKKPIR
ncbi:dihydropteroate synthase-like protein [Staphylothermus hellenicus]|uniref:Dihydropteroate synthase-related protein n=1 Tax=Staphylothermus hellenicus (strain DSM 12710 / JCM 10830 / BK20S6-10-b1 / P8) TaxID=591019 RepID=D7D9M1_STAHD|nr:dihydropteroate synthase-like protein [Staphylothermus hellenicus]ADI32467.1 dihydropteroate synthase-related protein [Staphylothermus hellenicus DSM 12710]